jgi:peptide chain release factor 1
VTQISSERIASIEARRHELQQAMSRGDVSPEEFVRLSKDYAAIEPVAAAAREVRRLRAELEVLNGMVADPNAEPELKEMAAHEADEIRHKLPEAERALAIKLLPRDAADDRAAMLEVRAGTGGDEAALFAGDLLRMYQRYAESRGWKFEMIDLEETGLRGVKSATAIVEGAGAYSRLKYEGGVHRVQRVPQTEASGRIHTSAATVAVLPEAEDVDIEVNEKDIRVDRFCASGPGGQGVNTTYSAVRLTHLPTGIVVQCQDERSQIKNKAKAMRVLKARLLEVEQEKQQGSIAAERKKMVGSGDRSEKIRTYNFPQSRVTDHRVGVTSHRLQEILDGRLDELIEPLTSHFRAEKLKEQLASA